MNIAQLSEQLKDVPQNRLIDYARNPNSVVPQFLALAEIQRRQQLSAQVAPPAATVAEDVLAQAQPAPQQAGLPQMAAQQPAPMAQQLPENQPGVAQLPTGMPQGMAGGGIVAFANGGLPTAEEEDAEDREMRNLFPQSGISFEDIMALPKNVGASIKDLVSKLPKSYEETKLKQSTMQPNTKGGHKYEEDVIKEAKRQGIDPNLALHVLYKETGNLKDPESARSKAGALGVMQLMPATAKELGVNPMDPYENIRGGVSYLKKMYDKYGDFRTAAAAYNAGPGNVDKALRRSGGLDTLSGETRNYIAGLAQGGEVKRYNGTEDSDVKDDSLDDNAYLKRSRGVVEGIKSLGSNISDAFTTPRNYDPITKLVLDPLNSIREWGQTPKELQAEKFRSYSMNPNKPATVGYDVPAGTNKAVPTGVATPSPYGPSENERLHARYPTPIVRPSEGPSQQDFRDFDQAAALFQAENANKLNAPVEAPKSKYDLMAEKIEQELDAQAAKAAKAGDMNLALSIMQAGLGMLASKSPYGLTGIGEGAQQGVSTFAALKKQEADQARDIMAQRLGLYRYGASSEAAKREYDLKMKAYADRLGMSEKELEYKIGEGARKDREFKEQNAVRIEQMLRNALKNNYTMTDEQKDQWVMNHPMMKKAYQGLDIDPSQIGVPGGPPTAAIEALKKDPSLKAQFDSKYGAGASDKYLGK